MFSTGNVICSIQIITKNLSFVEKTVCAFAAHALLIIKIILSSPSQPVVVFFIDDDRSSLLCWKK
tara:strand:+ start:111 stop:305 length:195 start_codon:yes stop_codon:yes gene_type:complete